MTRPLILLDVDGPLNPYEAKPTQRPGGYTTHRLTPTGWRGKPLRVWLAPEHGPLLLAFAERHDAELVWATTWESDANTMIGPVIGLPELPVIRFGGAPWQRKNWKFDGVAEYAGDRPLVWFDDDFGIYHAEAQVFLARRGDRPTLLHHVSPRVGLTTLDLDQAGAWLAALKEKTP